MVPSLFLFLSLVTCHSSLVTRHLSLVTFFMAMLRGRAGRTAAIAGRVFAARIFYDFYDHICCAADQRGAYYYPLDVIVHDFWLFLFAFVIALVISLAIAFPF